MKVTIKGIEIEINGQPVILTVEDAKQLQRELTDLLGDKTVPVPHYVPMPYYPEPPIYYPPSITWYAPTGTGKPPPPNPITTCTGGKQ
jgi:hypothetical protein